MTFPWVVMIGGRSTRLPFLSPIRIHPFRDRVAMNPQRCGGVRDPLLVARVGLLNIKLLEFFERFIQHDVPVKHVFNYCFQAGAYLHFYFVLILIRSPSVSEGHLNFESTMACLVYNG